jgi:asparagine synthase (glutamine-hydrolysing)
MLASMKRRGTDRVRIWHEDGVTLAVSRYEWELETDFSGNILLLVEPDLVVAADASIIYRDDLRRRLRDHEVEPVGSTATHLIAAAYRAFGDRCPRILEGEFSFILWDRKRRRALCSRDFLGKRPLHYSEQGHSCIVASTIGGVVAHPEVPDDLHLPSLAATAAGMHAAGPETCFAAIATLPAGSDLVWSDGRLCGPTRHWDPEIRTDSLSFSEASEELRALLHDAIRERLASSGATSIWMSGGWDSPAVFGAGQDLLRKEPGNRRLLPVSISYPEGDPGREDELINAIASHWDTPVHWLDIADFSLFALQEPEPPRDEPYQHLYEQWNRSLARGSRAVESRVALDGNGGDQVFQVSDVYFADLFASGKWIELRRDWSHRGVRGFRPFFQTAVQPVLPQVLLDTARVLRGGRRLRHYIERWTPDWFLPEFLNQSQLAERDREYLPRRTGSRADAESAWYWTSAFFHRAFAHLTGFALVEGVELRSPLADRRIVEFGLRRPREERASGMETKRLLRAAVKGLLPDHVLAPRRWRTGTTNGFSHREMSQRFPGLLQDLRQQPMELERLGIIDPDQLTNAARTYRRRDQAALRVALYYTYHTERWLRTWRRCSKDNAPGAVRSSESFTDRLPVANPPVMNPVTGRDGPVPEKEDWMYSKPTLQRFGTFRELTLLGADPDCDGGPASGNGSTVRCLLQPTGEGGGS